MPARRRDMSTRLKKRVAIGLALLFAVLWYAARTSQEVRAQALEIAAGDPYCVQVANDIQFVRGAERGYRPVQRSSDIWGLRMVGYGGFHHAVLVVGDSVTPRTFHWSYFKRSFVQGTFGPFPIVCQPSRDYFDHLHSDPADSPVRFILDGRRLSIPRVYRPYAIWPGSFLGYTFHAAAPAFQPVGASCTDFFCGDVWVSFTDSIGPYGLAQAAPAGGIPELGKLDGLLHLPGAKLSYDRYVQVGGDGNVVTSIDCMADCHQAFMHGGLTFSFRHKRADLSEWRAMQQRLIDLHGRFEQPDSIAARGAKSES